MGNPQVHGDIRDSYGKDALGIKTALQFNISESSDVTLRINYGKDDDVPSGAYVRSIAAPDPITGLGFYVQKSDEPFEYNADTIGTFDRDLLSSTLQFNIAVNENMDFTSITNYMDMEKFYTEDTEGLASGVPAAAFDTFYLDNDGNPITVQSFFPEQPLGADLPGFQFTTDQDFQQITQEFRLSGSSDSVKWQAGLYYLDIDTDNFVEVRGAAAWWTGGPASNFQPSKRAANNWTVDTESWSVFGQLDVDLSSALLLTVGLRWTEDEKENDFYARYETKDGVVLHSQVDFVPGPDISPICYSASVDSRCIRDVADSDAEISYSDWAGKVQLDWHINENYLLYAGINKGIKAGNWSSPTFPDSINLNGLDRLSHDEETLYSYETGVKLTLSDGKVRFNAAAFYYDYQDYQAFSVINFNQSISNNDATVTGAEFELFMSPWEGWDFLLGGSFLDTDVSDIETPTGLLIDTEMPQAPEVSINGLARYEFDIANGSLAAQLDFNYNGEHWMEVTNAPLDEEDSYLVANARLTYKNGDGKWRVTGWVKNLSDEEYRIYALDVSGAPSPFVNDVFGSPRTYGLTASYSFE